MQLPLVDERCECLGGGILAIAHSDASANFTNCPLSSFFLTVVDEPLTGGLGFTGCCSSWVSVQAKSIDNGNFFLALPGCFLELLDEHSQTPDVLRACWFVGWEI